MDNFKNWDWGKILGGIFGGIAIAAAIIALCLDEITGAAVWGCVKDVAGTATAVVLFFAVLNQNKRKKSKNFKEEFDRCTDDVLAAYKPYVVRKDGTDEKFQITANLKCIFGTDPGQYFDFFNFDLKNTFSFSVKKGLFYSRGEAGDDVVESIARSISDKLHRDYEEYTELPVLKKDGSGFAINFKNELCTKEDAKLAAQFINTAIMCYIAYNHTL
ncbi:MAG: hypothetical protein NC253_08825 [Ruminococcus sp.]|nr:hypothetical protein [Ruminococcus sp.]MCM1380502.1 hypothetical protein [Muribaculaceae bacterium]MCM1478882.1 hypothetical protein [Muribaculaceae bacterium]